MKNKYPFVFFLLFVITATLFTGCSKEIYEASKRLDNYTVNADQAITIAKQAFSSSNGLYKSSNPDVKIKNNKTFLDKNSLPYFHIINLENESEKTFIIVSGDERTMPILAYSKSNFFDLDGKLPYGVVDWLQSQEKYIDSIRGNHVEQLEAIKNQWTQIILPENQINSSNLKNAPITDPNDCTGSYSIIKNPLLTTTWGYGCVYNAQCPSGCGDCNHNPTGCVATAMAQILMYYQHQTNYNWASLQNHYTIYDFGLTGASEIARLMKDAGTSVNMSYGCNESGANMTKVDNAFEQNFGYSSGGTLGKVIDNIETIKSNLLYNHPVIFSGCRIIHFFGLWYTGCHAWVGDGFMQSYDCHTGYGWLSYHMNWGWNDSYNGWYGIDGWSPGTYNYQYDQDVIVNIHP